jgi:hypothetical protein
LATCEKGGPVEQQGFNQGFYGWLRVVHDGFACFLNQDNNGIVMGNIDGFILSSSVIKHGDIPELNGGFKWENHRSKSGGFQQAIFDYRRVIVCQLSI